MNEMMAGDRRLVSARDGLTIARIVRVNHAGEYGAIRIYRAQIIIARSLWPDCVPVLAGMLADERRHLDIFHAAMPPRQSRPCRVMRFWSLGGWVLGFGTALLGRHGIWACTAAVEAAVHRHLEDQLRFLVERDPPLHQAILDIQEEELAHLRHAEDRLDESSYGLRRLRDAIALVTDVLIWLSTWGDSARMARALK